MAYEEELKRAFDEKWRGVLNAGVDEATQARIMQQRAADRAAAQAATTAAAPASGAAPPKPGFGARLKGAAKALVTPSTYNPSMGQLGKAGAKLGKVGLVAAPVFGALDAAADDSATVRRVAEMTDNPFTGNPLDYNSFGGRLGANTLNFLRKTGDEATFGLAGRVGRVLSGGNFFEDDAPAAMASSAPARAGGAGVPAGDFDVAPDEALQAPAFPVAAPQAGGIRSRVALGPVEEFGGYIEGPNGRVNLSSGTRQRFGVRRGNLADNVDAARERWVAREDEKIGIQGIEAMTRLKSAGRSSAEETIAKAKLAAADAYIKANPTDIGGYVSILSGKDPREVTTVLPNATGQSTAIDRFGRTITPSAGGGAVRGTVWDNPPPNIVEALRKNRDSPAHRAEFLRRFGPENYAAALK